MHDLAALAIAAIRPYLPATGDDPAAEALRALLAGAFRAAGHQESWREFTTDPSGTVPVERILRAAMNDDEQLISDIEKAVAQVTDNSHNWNDQSHARIGRDGNIVGRDYKRSTSFGGPFAIAAVVIIAVVALLGGKAIYSAVTSSAGLDKNSTCADFLKASQEDELSAIRTIGVDEGVQGIGSPLALPSISYSCSGEPDAKLGDVIAKTNGSF
jgi:hypothetical protein